VLLARERSGSTVDAGWLVAAATFPQLLSGPLTATLLDRYHRPWDLLRLAGVVTAVACCAIAVTLGRAPLVFVAVAAIAVACCEPLFNGGISALAGRGRSARRAFAWDSFAYNVAGLGGPALVTVVAVIATPAWSLVALGLGCAAIAATSIGLTIGDVTGHRPAPPLATLTAAFETIVRRPPLRASTLASTLAFAGFGALPLALVSATDRLGRPPSAAGLVLTLSAIGGLVGSLAMTRVRAPACPEHAVLWSLLATGAVLVAISVGPWPLLLAGAVTLGVIDAPLLVALFAVRSDNSPGELRATVFTLAASAKLGVASIGAVLAGTLLDGRATGAGLAVIGAIQMLAAAFGRLALGWRAGESRERSDQSAHSLSRRARARRRPPVNAWRARDRRRSVRSDG
jgi:MFS family permease